MSPVSQEEVAVESSVEQIWNAWDIRMFMLTSLLIQALLTFLAPHRKRSASCHMKFSMWLLYLSADAVAIFTIGLITSSQGDTPQKLDLLAFWAPFLLLHLGGPDTITALALEDNELWHRHALQLASQILVTLYVFGQSLRGGDNHLWLPTVLMFVDGCIKYTERTQALYFASMENFREPLDDMISDDQPCVFGDLIPTTIQGQPSNNNNDKSLGRNDQDNLPQVPCNTGDTRNVAQTNSKDVDADIDEDAMINDAFKLCMKFKGLLTEAFVSLKDREDSRSLFLDKAVSKAYRLIEIELNFIYDVFYTKVFLLQKTQAYARILSFCSVIASLVLFSFKDKSMYHNVDVGITFALLGGAIALDSFSVLMLVESDWWIIITPKLNMPKNVRSFLMYLRQYLRRTTSHSRTRWSESISRYNLLDRCFKDPPTILNYVVMKRIKHALMGFLYVVTKPVDEQVVVNFIIEELRKKAKLAADVKTMSKEVSAARGNLVLENDYHLVSEYLNPWTLDVDYDESVLVWHLATDICYYTTSHDTVQGKQYRNFCKQISDYMLYLLLRRKALVSLVVGMSESRFEDTLEEAKKYMDRDSDVFWIGEIFKRAKRFIRKKLHLHWCSSSAFDQNRSRKKEEVMYREFCTKILKMQAHVQSAKGDKNKSVLFDACRLAKQMKMFGDVQWEITSKVWVELLCYAATRCPPTSHVAQLCKGGELITLVWLLMAHLGLGERFLAKARVWVD